MEKLHFNNGLALVPSRSTDAPFIEALFRSTRSFLLNASSDTDFVESLVEQQLCWQTSGYGNQYPNAMTFIVQLHSERIGRAVVDFSANVAHLVDLMFIPQAQGKGYGKSVINALQQAAAKVSVPMTLVVDLSNTAAISMYQNLGFTVESIKSPCQLMVWYPTN
ncbi:GNAT family N-acetyltransferase [Shewanella kaireitica]|uniref:GNAT family N-acetyltransferase n=1 Tax=Shewanella kaireitica TaxID=212021 RepID=UPI00200C9352|nr:GNAT family N-acetyltransferase [Shewanella kaireitica]MCL1093343.1 GNAT family N-acetyltransferase [Shewanella kaireitica]